MKTLGIIYSDKDGIGTDAPFTDRDSQTAYTLFSKETEKRGMQSIISGPSAYQDGTLSWGWNLLTKEKVHDAALDLAWDRAIDPGKDFFLKHQEFLTDVADRMPVANHPAIVAITEDKYETFKTFPDHIPQTFTGSELAQAHAVFKGQVVTKPKYGSHGDNVEIRDISEVTDLPDDYLIQPFLDSSAGIPGLIDGTHDLRVAVLDGAICDTYIRYPVSGFISNVSRGGKMKLVKAEQLPDAIVEIVKLVDARFAAYTPRLYSIDFMFDGTRPWIIELNKAPGIWGHLGAGVPIEYLEKLCGDIAEAFAKAAQKL